MKSYTDLEQSKKLAKILPLESSDFGWNVFVDNTTRILPINDWDLVKDGSGNVKFYHAWSLAALLGVLPKIGAEEPMVIKLYYASEPKERYICEYSLTNMTNEYDNPVDACYEMIMRLHELKML